MKIVNCLFAFLALSIALVNCNVIRDDNDDDGDDNVIVVVNTAAQKIIEAIVGVVTNLGIDAIDGLSNSVSKIEEKLNSLQQNLVDLLWDIVDKQLDAAEPGASNFTKAVIKCVKERGDFLKTMVYDFASQSTTCEIEKTVTTFNTYLPLLTDIRDTNEDLKILTNKFDECGNDAAAIPCIDEIQDEMEATLSELLNTVINDIADASKLQEDIVTSASLCHQDATAKLQEKTEQLSAISECIQQNLN